MQQGRALGFWETMCEIAHDDFGGTGMVLQIARVAGPLTPELLRASTAALQRRHPLLRARLRTSAKGSRLVVDAEPTPARIRSVFRASEDLWKDIAEEELLAKFVPDDGYPWRLVLVGGVARSELVMVFHHVIADGLSSMRFTSALLVACERIARGDDAGVGEPLPLLPAAESMLRAPASWLGFLGRQMGGMVFGPKPTPLAFERDAPIEERRTRSIYRVLDEAALARLADRCQREGTSVGAAFDAALVLAVVTVRGGAPPWTIPCNSAVSVRRSCEPEVGGEHFGCFVTVLSATHHVRADTALWDLARERKQRLDRQLARGRLLPGSYHKPTLASAAGRVVAQVNRARQYRLGVVVSNLGRLDLPERYGPFHLEEMYFGTSRHAADYVFCLHVETLFGKAFCCFAYEAPLVSDRSAERIVGECLRFLGCP